jgi:epoxyqueuosine reductase
MLPADTIKQRALEVGFDLVGISPPSAAKDLEFLPQWLKKGYGGEMRYLANPRREDLRRVLPSVKSVICVGLIYNTLHPYSTDLSKAIVGESDAPSKSSPAGEAHPRAWISRYAWGKDYHKVMRGKLELLRKAVEKLEGNVETRVYVDTGPIVERAFARLSGMGWMGKNTCIINERKGSWFFLGVILTNLDLQWDLPAPDRCGSCTRCLEACPTGALVEPYAMDASRCISYFNIELKGSIPEKFRKAMGRNLFGCDICQDVCPWNGGPSSVVGGLLPGGAGRDEQSGDSGAPRRAATTALPEFQPLQVEIKSGEKLGDRASQSQSPPQPSSPEPFSLLNPPLEALASIPEEDFKKVFARSPIKRAKYRGWLRSLCVVMGNSGDRRFIPWLEAAASNSDPVLQEHAAWALRRLQERR